MKTALTLTLLFSFSTSFSQVFHKVHGTPMHNETVVDIIETYDGNLLVMGRQNGFDAIATPAAPYLLKMTPSGDTLWTKRYELGYQTFPQAMTQLPDSSIVMAGYGTSGFGQQDMFLIKTDRHGDHLWTKTHGGTQIDEARDVTSTPDGGVFVSGRTMSGGSGWFLGKFDANGDMEWGDGYMFGSWALEGIATNDGGYLAAGATTFMTSKMGLVKLDSVGNVQWNMQIGATNIEYGRGVVQHPVSGDFYLVGDGQYPGYNQGIVHCIDANGNYKWNRIYTSNQIVQSYFENIKVLPNGDLGIVGSVRLNVGTPIDQDLAYVRLDTAGNVLGAWHYGLGTLESGAQLVPTGDHVNLVGTTDGYSNSNDIVIIRVDTAGLSGSCYQTAFNLDINSDTAQITTTFQFPNSNLSSGTEIPITLGCPFPQTDAALQLSTTADDVTCNGFSNGSGVVQVVQNGVGPYSYIWSSGDTNSLATGLAAGTHYVTVLGANGSCSAVDSVVVSEPVALSSNVSSIDASCHDLGDGTATINPVGGTPPYLYSWSNGQNTATAVGLFAGLYNVNIIDVNGCLTSNNVIVGQPSAISISSNLTATYCGQNSGSAELSVGGGTSPYTYSWQSGADSTFVDSLASGTHGFTITDANGCTLEDSVLIPVGLDPVQFCVITVDESSQYNHLIWEKPAANHIEGFRIYRNMLGSYGLVGYVEYDSLSEFVDQSFGIDPNITSYRYKITAVDSCGNESVMSPYHETMHLIVVPAGNDINLIWDAYDGVPFTFYRILRDSTGNQNWEVLDSVPDGNFTYTDANPPSYASYMVQVVIPNTCTSTRANHNTTRSNRSSPIGAPSGVEEHMISELNLYPNPSQGRFTLEFISSSNADAVIAINDVQGRLLHEQSLGLRTGLNRKEFSLNNLAPGMYQCTLMVGQQVTTQRLVISQ